MATAIQHEFQTEVEFLNIPMTIVYEIEQETPAGEKILQWNIEDKITFPQIIDKVLKLFGGNGFKENFEFEGLSFSKTKLTFNLSKKTMAFESLVELKEVKLDFQFNFWELKSPNGEKDFVFEFILKEELRLPGGLPVIKDELKNNVVLEFDKILVATRAVEEKGIKQGFQFLGKAKVFSYEQDIDLYLFGPSAENNDLERFSRSPESSEGTAPANNSTKWIDINKTLGPLGLRKIGFQFDGGKIWALMSVDFLMGPMTFSLEGLKVGTKLALPPKAEDIEFGINGVGLSMKNDPIQITGAFLKSPTIPNYYSGLAIIQFTELTIDAFGGYGELEDGSKAVFVFASVNIPMGGPPFFFVKGFSLGFGYNMNFDIPPAREIPAFPLLNTALFEKSSPTEALEKLNKYIYPKAGGLWFAVGIKFTTFEVVDTNAVLVIDIGKLQISIIGIAALVLPKVGYAFVNVKLGIVVILNIKEGFFLAHASISDDSYVIHSSCKVYGEFAFYAWFKGVNAGDFVFSVGGYHPRFRKPSHYPEIRRVGFNWRVSSAINILGECYFTLTSSAVMAGFRFEAVFELWEIKAWFIAIADFLIQWKPFYYDIYIKVSVGIKFSVFKLERGIELLIYGPPVGGYATVDAGVVEFTIHFGEPMDNKPVLMSWGQFKENYLPPPSLPETEQRSLAEPIEEVCRVNISNGLLKKGKNDLGQEVWLVRADELIMGTETVIPAKSLRLRFFGDEGGKDISTQAPATIGVRPMGVSNLYHSAHQVKITNLKDGNEAMRWKAQARNNRVPAALWATTPVNPKVPEAETIPAITGLRQLVALKWEHPTVAATRIDNFKYFPVSKSLILTQEKANIHSQLVEMDAAERSELISTSIMQFQQERNQLIHDINTFFELDQTEDSIQDNLHLFGTDIEESFQSIPRIGRIKNTGNIAVQAIELQPLEEPLSPTGKAISFFNFRQALRQYANSYIVDYTLIQKDLWKDKDNFPARINEGAMFLFDIRNQWEKKLSYTGGKALQLLTFNSLYQVDLIKISNKAMTDIELPQQTQQLVAFGLPHYNPNFFVCGWDSHYYLPQVNQIAFVGAHFVLRPQAPIPLAQGWWEAKKLLNKNKYLGDNGQSFKAYTDTQFLNSSLKEVVILVKNKKPQTGLTERIRVNIPYIVTPDKSDWNYEPNMELELKNTASVNGFTRLCYRVRTHSSAWNMLAVRTHIPDELQQYWEIHGVFGLCGQVPAQAWRQRDLAAMTNQVRTSDEQAPVLTIE